MADPADGADDPSRSRNRRSDSEEGETPRESGGNEAHSRRRDAGARSGVFGSPAHDARPNDSAPAASEEDDDPPRVVEAIGSFGVYLALVSLAITPLGIAGMYVGFQPYGNLATTFALVGVTVAMILGMAHRAYTADPTSWG